MVITRESPFNLVKQGTVPTMYKKLECAHVELNEHECQSQCKQIFYLVFKIDLPYLHLYNCSTI